MPSTWGLPKPFGEIIKSENFEITFTEEAVNIINYRFSGKHESHSVASDDLHLIRDLLRQQLVRKGSQGTKEGMWAQTWNEAVEKTLRKIQALIYELEGLEHVVWMNWNAHYHMEDTN